MNRRQALLMLLAAAGSACLPFVGARAAGSRRALAQQLARQTGLNVDTIARILRQARFLPDVIAQIRKPYEARPYAAYRKLFVRDSLRRQGMAYLTTHAAHFARSAERYAIEPEIVAAILGMETRFGRNQGRTRLLDALFTLSTGYARRAAFFQRELGELLLLCREEGLDPQALTGSYAGAFGATQFMPSSYRAYAVDADGDGRRDVWHSPADIIASVAHYFHRHGWQRGRPVAYWLPWREDFRARAARGMREFTPLAGLRAHLPTLPSDWRDTDLVAVIAMPLDRNRQGMALIHRNFYVITRWNRSYNYAMACSELAALLGCAHCRPGRI